MLKKPLIGVCISAVIILVLCSFTNVVGYQTLKTTATNESPLFAVRTMRATNQDSEDGLLSNFLGKNQPNSIPFQLRNNKTMLLLNIIDRINKMSYRQYVQFVNVIVNHLNTDGRIPKEENQKIVAALLLLKTNPIEIIQYISSGNKLPFTADICETSNGLTLACLLFYIFIRLPFAILMLILIELESRYWATHPTTFPCCSNPGNTFS